MFSAPSEVVALLTAELGAPHSSTHDTRCGYDIVRWERLVGGPLDVWAQFSPTPGGPPTVVYVNRAEVSGVRVETTAGFAVGDDITAYVFGLPADRINPYTGEIVWEPGTSASSGGKALRNAEDVVLGLVTPAALDGSLRAACWG